METKQARFIDRYLELSAESPGNAEAFMSGLVKPKRVVQIGFTDECTGERLSAVDTFNVLTQDVLNRGTRPGQGEQGFNRSVEHDVKRLRREALAQSSQEVDYPFTMALVCTVLDGVKTNKRSLHLPRGAAKAKLLVARQLTWALVNFAMVMGLVASTWAREISPLHKGGPDIVSDPVNLRPVGYLSDLAGILDALWLASVKVSLDTYSGSSQGGGKHDAVLMVIGLLITLQIRMHRGL